MARAKVAPGPLFTFAHIICPHAPYVFDRDGPLPTGGTSLTKRRKTDAYAEQVRFVNARILELLDAIERTSGKDAIVILQGGHGSDYSPPGDTLAWERSSIFSAYRVPAQTASALYPGITPVNSFRLLLRTYFGQPVTSLEDHCYFSPGDRLWDLREVTGIRGPSPGK